MKLYWGRRQKRRADDHEPAGMNGGCLAFLLVFLACAAAAWWAFGRQG